AYGRGRGPTRRGAPGRSTSPTTLPAQRPPGRKPRRWRGGLRGREDRCGPPRSFQLPGLAQDVAAAADRVDEPVVAARREALAQAPDVHVHRALLDEDVVAP